jgi:hypothetical protein
VWSRVLAQRGPVTLCATALFASRLFVRATGFIFVIQIGNITTREMYKYCESNEHDKEWPSPDRPHLARTAVWVRRVRDRESSRNSGRTLGFSSSSSSSSWLVRLPRSLVGRFCLRRPPTRARCVVREGQKDQRGGHRHRRVRRAGLIERCWRGTNGQAFAPRPPAAGRPVLHSSTHSRAPPWWSANRMRRTIGSSLSSCSMTTST